MPFSNDCAMSYHALLLESPDTTDLQYIDFIVRARLSSALRRRHEREAVKTLAFLGRLHGRMVQPRQFPRRVARLAARRRSRVRGLHSKPRGQHSCCVEPKIGRASFMG